MKKKILIYPVAIICMLLLFANSCKNDDENNIPSKLVPGLTTSQVTDITKTTAICGGNITSDSNSPVTVRGVCWSKAPTPTIADNKTSDGSGTGIFTSTITGLTMNTKYYVRAYATNSYGTGYGSVISFTTDDNAIGSVPSNFTQKVMIEENTGSWCGWCVLGADGIKTVDEANPGKVNAVALHGGSTEPMYIPEYYTMLTFCGASGVPHYQLNRGTSGGFPGAFTTIVSTALAQTAECGLAIDGRRSNDSTVTVTVHAGFKSDLPGDYRLMLYLVEDVVQNSGSAYNQQNYVSGNASYSSNPYYSLPAVINNFEHKHVARKLLSASLQEGDQIPASYVKGGNEFIKTYTYAIPKGSDWKPVNLRVVAGILKYSSTCSYQNILNSQSVKLGSVQSWD
jgi:hypothetical protein